MVNDFGYGPSYNIGASRQMKFPYIWVEQGQSQTLKSVNGYKENIYTFTLFCMDKINMGEDNYSELMSDTHYILDGVISEISQHKFYIESGISLIDNIIMDPVMEATDDNVNGWQCDLTFKVPVFYTPCNSPIRDIE
jgi:hypothetical protein